MRTAKGCNCTSRDSSVSRVRAVSENSLASTASNVYNCQRPCSSIIRMTLPTTPFQEEEGEGEGEALPLALGQVERAQV